MSVNDAGQCLPRSSENAADSPGPLEYPTTAEVVRTLLWSDSFRTMLHAGVGFNTAITLPPNRYADLHVEGARLRGLRAQARLPEEETPEQGGEIAA